MPSKKEKSDKDKIQHIKESSNQAIKYLILILASLAIIQIFSVILIASNPKAYNTTQKPKLKTITQKILNGNNQKYYCENKTDCVDGSYCEKTDDGCVSADWWWENVGYKFDCFPASNSSPCECINNKCEKKDQNETINFSIERKEEAIEYAKKDPDLMNHIKEYSDNGLDADIYLWGEFDEEQNVWVVSIPVVDTTDLWFEIHFRPDGTILSKGEEAGG